MPDMGQREMRDIDREPDGAGPDQGIAHHGHRDGARRLLFRRGIMRRHGNGEHIDQRDDRDHRHRGQRQPGIAIEISGDRKRDIGLPAGRALEDGGESRAVNGEFREQGA